MLMWMGFSLGSGRFDVDVHVFMGIFHGRRFDGGSVVAQKSWAVRQWNRFDGSLRGYLETIAMKQRELGLLGGELPTFIVFVG